MRLWYYRSIVELEPGVHKAKRGGADLAELEQLRAEAEAAAQRFRDLVEELNAIVWERDATSLRLSFVSRHIEHILGYTVEQCLAEPDFWVQHLHPNDREHAVAFYGKALAEGGDHELDYRIIAADGRVVCAHDTCRVVRDAAGRARLLRGVLVDISEHKRAEEARARLTAVIEATSDFVGVADAGGREIYINRAGRRLIGMTDDEDVSATRVADHQPQWARAIVRDQGVPTAVRDGVWSGETALLTRQGEEIPISQVILAHKTAGGEVDFFATIARDISERKHSEARMDGLLKLAKDISGTLDLDDVLDRVQRHTAALLPCERVITYYWDPERQLFREIARYGLPDGLEQDAAAVEFRPGHPIVDRMTAGHTVVMNDILEQNLVPAGLLRHFGISALIAVPMTVRDRTLGALVAVNAPGVGRFDTAQVQMLESIARHVGVAIETRELYRSQQDEAQITAALARVAREMIPTFATPVVLDRLCQLTTEVLGCDCSHTLVWKPEEDAYVAVSGYGYPPEQWESLRVTKLPRAVFGADLDDLERAEVANIATAAFPHIPAAALALEYGITRALCAVLRRGGEMIGMLVACDRGPQEPFPRQQERIVRGIAQLASLALENARLVEELGRASRLKSDFVATMSHELRTPLNVIVGYNDLLLDGAFGEMAPEQAETLGRVQTSAYELLELINATLDMSRLESGRLPLDLEDVCVQDLIAEIDAETRALRDKPGIRCVWDVPAECAPLRTDRVKLKVILKNLVGNAVKFTEAGTITISARRTNGQVEFRIADTGIGIAPETRAVIFEPFRQADGSATRRYGGVGLGLYIVRRLLEILGGAVAIDSEVGKGSTFRVSVPDRWA